MKVGDIVLVKAEQPRSQWPLAKIISIHPDREGILRVVKGMGQSSLRTVDSLIPSKLSELKTEYGDSSKNREGQSTRAAAAGAQRNWRNVIAAGQIT